MARQTCASVLIAACIVACAGAARIAFRSPVFMDENSLSPVAQYGSGRIIGRDRVRINHGGPRLTRVVAGGRLELECQASGSPPPSVVWRHNGNPLAEVSDENNSIGDDRLGTTMARLVIDCVTPHHQGSYTCAAMAGTAMDVSLPTLLLVQGNNASTLLPPCAAKMASPPRIVSWSSSLLETQGNDAVLPCASMGSPPPQVFWVDPQDNLVISNDHVKVMESGELVINSVRWGDMGTYTCVAESPLGRDTVSTFLYPMKKSL